MGGVVVLPSLHGDAQIIAQAGQTRAEVLVTLQDFGVAGPDCADLPAARGLDRRPARARYLPAPTAVIQRAGSQDRDRPLLKKPVGRSMAELIQDAPAHGLDLSRCSDLAVVAFSNDADGSPRGACLTHSNLVANALQLRHWLHDLQMGRKRSSRRCRCCIATA